MIIPEFLEFKEQGLYCRLGDFYLDPRLPVHNAVISHAHGDHATSGQNHVFCTEATSLFMQLRFKKQSARQFHIKSFHETFNLNGVHLRFIPAGHILGSAQVLMEYDNVKYLYTGDYKLQQDDTCEPFEYINADVLITETTFANPLVVHPDPEQEIRQLNQNNFNVLLGAYSLGKSQRLINLINRFCPERKILVHFSILPLIKIYEQLSYPPGNYEPYNRKLMKEPNCSYVYLVPPFTFNSYFRAKNVLRIFASGWNNLQVHNDMKLFISDHADWNDILKVVEMVKPSEIWTLHGDGRHLKTHIGEHIPVKILS